MLPAIRSIHALLKFHARYVKDSQSKGDGCLTTLLSGISSPSIHIPAYNQKVRMCAFKCYEYVLNNYKEFFEVDNPTQVDNHQQDGTENSNAVTIPYSTIVSAVLTAIESEKDPRNLLVSFELTRLILNILGNDDTSVKIIEPFLEEIFENISCYYPIEFEPPKNDKFKITSKELKDRLNNCFVASPIIAPLAFPFILEKLTSVSAFPKKESLRTLQRMINELPIQKVREFCEIIWNHLQNETFNSFDESVQNECIDTIASLCAVLSNTKDKFMPLQYDSISEKVISQVLEKCRSELEMDPDTLTGILASNILCAIMKKSPTLCYVIVDKFLIQFCIGK